MLTELKIGDFLHRKKDPVKILPDEEYSLVTVKLYHKGVILREKKKGSLLGSNMYRVSAGDFILSGIDARNGAFGIVPEELEGAIVTNDFWYFDVDELKVKRDFFYWLTTTPLFLDACQKSSKGETQRIRLQKDLFNGFVFHFPPIEEQDSFLQRFGSIDKSLSALKMETANQSSFLTKLRQAILQEAIEGKLTADWREENPVRKGNPDYDAESLMEKIQTEKEKLIKEGKIKKQKPLDPIKAEEVPFELPEGWVWTRLGGVSQVFAGYSFNSYDFKTKNGAKCIKITNAGVQQLIESEERLPSDYVTQYKDFLVKTNDLIIALTRPYISNGLKISRCPESFNNALLNQRVAAIRNYFSLNWNYIFQFMTSDFVLNGYKDKFEKVNLQPNLKMSDVTELHVPLPPLAEQHVIVDRIEKLLSMVDELEKQVSERKKLSEQLMQTVLREAFEGVKCD